MNDTEKLIKKLDTLLGIDGLAPSVSPMPSTSGAGMASPDSLYIDENLSVDSLSNDQLLMAHALLHKFWSTGNKKLSKETIKNLHDKIKEKINHSPFDSLDR